MAYKKENGGLSKWVLWLMSLWGGVPLNAQSRKGFAPYRGKPKNIAGKKRKALAALRHNLALMCEAVGKYEVVIAECEAYEGFETATALDKIYKKVRAGLNPVGEDVFMPETYVRAVLTHEIFNEISLLCGAADMSAVLGGTDYGVGFETLTSIQLPGSNMFQPAKRELSNETLTELAEAIEHFNEEIHKLIKLIDYEGGQLV